MSLSAIMIGTCPIECWAGSWEQVPLGIGDWQKEAEL